MNALASADVAAVAVEAPIRLKAPSVAQLEREFNGPAQLVSARLDAILLDGQRCSPLTRGSEAAPAAIFCRKSHMIDSSTLPNRLVECKFSRKGLLIATGSDQVLI